MVRNQRGAVDPVTLIWAVGLLLAMLSGAYQYVAKNPPPDPQAQTENTAINSGRK